MCRELQAWTVSKAGIKVGWQTRDRLRSSTRNRERKERTARSITITLKWLHKISQQQWQVCNRPPPPTNPLRHTWADKQTNHKSLSCARINHHQFNQTKAQIKTLINKLSNSLQSFRHKTSICREWTSSHPPKQVVLPKAPPSKTIRIIIHWL